MNLLKHKLALILVLPMFIFSLGGILAPALAQAASSSTYIAAGDTELNSNFGENFNDSKKNCKQDKYSKLTTQNCSVLKLIVVITNTMAAAAAIVIVIMMIIGGIQYSMAGGADASKVQAAKSKIMNALLALFLLIFGYAFLQWLVPGGIF